MTTGPYRPGRNKMRADRLNETDSLARRPFRFGEGFEVTETPNEVRVNLRQKKQYGRGGASTPLRYGYVIATTPSSRKKLLVQFLKKAVTEDGGQTYVSWSADGGPRMATVPPNMEASDFANLTRPTFNLQTPVFRFDWDGSDWMLSFEPRWAYRALPDGAQTVRCG